MKQLVDEFEITYGNSSNPDTNEDGVWINVYVPKRWISFLKEYAEWVGYKDPVEQDKYINIELQASVRDFIFAVLDIMRKSNPVMREYFIQKYKLEEDVKLTSDRIYYPE